MSLCTVCGKVCCNHTASERGQTEQEVRRPLTEDEELAVGDLEPHAAARLAIAKKNAHLPATPKAHLAYEFLRPYYQ